MAHDFDSYGCDIRADTECQQSRITIHICLMASANPDIPGDIHGRCQSRYSQRCPLIDSNLLSTTWFHSYWMSSRMRAFWMEIWIKCWIPHSTTNCVWCGPVIFLKTRCSAHHCGGYNEEIYINVWKGRGCGDLEKQWSMQTNGVIDKITEGLFTRRFVIRYSRYKLHMSKRPAVLIFKRFEGSRVWRVANAISHHWISLKCK